MPAKLRVRPSGQEEYEIEIGNTATVGRSRGNTVSFRGSPLVSRQHALLRCHNGIDYQLIDLGSLNGTWVDGQRVILPAPLRDGAVIRIGDHEITFVEIGLDEEEERLHATMAGTRAGVIPEAGNAALLVCDIRRFSSVAERVAPGQLAHLLGGWFREAGNAIAAAGGVTDKFIGDALLAYWMADQDPAEAGRKVLQAARALADLACSTTWPIAGIPFEVIVALHFGRVTADNIGTDAQRDATIIGDPVNTVFRIETLGKQLGLATILTAEFAGILDPRPALEDKGEHLLKGKKQPVRVFALA
jgi:adenylate cyclase